MTVIVCLFIRVLWLACWVQGYRGLLHCLVPSFRSFSSATAVHGDYRLFCVQKPCLPSKWGFRGKKKKKNSTWKYHNMLNISLHSTGMFWEYAGSFVIFPCVFSNCFLPTGHRGLLLRKKKKGNEIDITPLNATPICRENTVIHWQCLKIKHTPSLSLSLPLSRSLTSYSLHFRLNLLINH